MAISWHPYRIRIKALCAGNHTAGGPVVLGIAGRDASDLRAITFASVGAAAFSFRTFPRAIDDAVFTARSPDFRVALGFNASMLGFISPRYLLAADDRACIQLQG